MRDYSKVKPTFWTGPTGKAIRQQGGDAQRVAFYLMTCPNANMLGLYYLAMPTLCHEVGISMEGASEALRRLSEVSFAYYDDESEHAWVPEMASYQIGEGLDPKDNRHKGVLKELESLRKSPFFNAFLERYREPFNLQGVRKSTSKTKGLASPFEAPSKQEQEQEHKQEQDQERENQHRSVPEKAVQGGAALHRPLSGSVENSDPENDQIEEKLAVGDLLVRDIEHVTKEKNPGLHARIIRELPEAIIRRAISELKDEVLAGRAKKPGAEFTTILNRISAEFGYEPIRKKSQPLPLPARKRGAA